MSQGVPRRAHILLQRSTTWRGTSTILLLLRVLASFEQRRSSFASVLLFAEDTSKWLRSGGSHLDDFLNNPYKTRGSTPHHPPMAIMAALFEG